MKVLSATDIRALKIVSKFLDRLLPNRQELILRSLGTDIISANEVCSENGNRGIIGWRIGLFWGSQSADIAGEQE